MPKPSTSAPSETTPQQPSSGSRQRVSVARRIVITDVRPQVEHGRYPARRIVGDVIPVSADILCDGDATLRACILYRPQGESRWRPAPMQADVDARGAERSRWRGTLRLQNGGIMQFCIEAWIDVFTTWVHRMQKAIDVGETQSPTAPLLEQGQHLLDAALTRASGADLKLLAECRESLHPSVRSPSTWQRWLANRHMHKRMLVHGDRRHVVRSEPVLTVEASRRRAAFVTGCRHAGASTLTSQSANDLRQCGVELVQVGTAHPLVDWPAGMDRAEPLTLPCAPSRHWYDEHPEWFVPASAQLASETHRNANRTLDFWCERRDALWDACLAALQARVRLGVRAFVASQAYQVPFPFWEWVIRRIHERHPEVLFLSAPVSDPVARTLSRVGFSQIQVHWDGSLEDALRGVQDLQRWSKAEWRPFVVVPTQARGSAQELHLVQLLAATSSACFGVQDLPEEAADLQWLRRLNRFRNDNRALQIGGNLSLLPITSMDVIATYRNAPQGRNDVVVVVNRQPRHMVEAQVRLPDLRLQPSDTPTLLLEDLLDGKRYHWQVGDNYVRLGPGLRQAHVFRVIRPSRLFV